MRVIPYKNKPDWTPLTVVIPFYGETERLHLQFENWKSWSPEVKDMVQIVLVDDCGTPAIADMLTHNRLKYLDFNLTVYRILEDLKWNTPGALNLGIIQATTHWIWIMDSDCAVKDEIMRKVLTLRLNDGCTYWFNRHRITDEEAKAVVTRPLGCCILFNKDQFAKSGPFDEDLVGSRSNGYGMFDWEFADRLSLFASRKIVEGLIVDEYLEDKVGQNIQQRTNVLHDHYRHNVRIIAEKGGQPAERLGKISEPLRFPWELAFEYRRRINGL